MRFTEDDFLFANVEGSGKRMVALACAMAANEKLDAWLSEAPVVYGWEYKGSVHEGIAAEWMWTPEQDSKDTHRARLVCIEPLHQNQTPLKSD